MKDYRHIIVDKILRESYRHVRLWGEQNHAPMIWLGILSEEFGELAKETNELHFRKGNRKKFEKELIQTAAVCVSMLDSLWRNNG